MAFSEICGENIVLSNNNSNARWKINFSGGVVFSEQTLKEGDVMRIDLTGSGHVEIGYINDDPNGIKDFREGIRRAKIMNEIRVHKRTCQIKISMSKKNINFSYNDKTNDVPVNKGSKVWVMLNLLFGNVEAIIGQSGTKQLKFHPNLGTNIEILDTTRQKVKLRKENPACVCTLNQKIYPGQEVNFFVEPLKEGDRAPSRYKLVMGFTNLDSRSLREGDPESFSVTEHLARPTRWNIAEKFDKNECDGNLSIRIEDGFLVYNHSSGKYNKLQLKGINLTSGVLIVLDLWRISVTCTGLRECQKYDYPMNVTGSEITGPSEVAGYLQLIDVPSREKLDMPDGISANRLSLTSMLESVDKSVRSGESWDKVEARLESIKQDMENEYVKPKSKTKRDSVSSERLSQTVADSEYMEPISRNPNGRNQRASIGHGKITEEKYNELCDRISRIEVQIESLQKSQTETKKVTNTIHELKTIIQSLPVEKSEKYDNTTKRDISGAVQKNYVYIGDNIELFPFGDHLFQDEYLNLNEFERLKELSQTNRYKAVQYILGILLKRPISEKILKNACDSTKQQHIFKKIMES